MSSIPGYVTGSVAGNALVYDSANCKITIMGGGAFEISFSGSNSRGTKGKVFTQIFDDVAKPFGLHFHYAPLTLVRAILEDINIALDSPDTFIINITDGYTTINHHCTWNFDQSPDGPTWPEQRTEEDLYVKDYILWFFAESPVE